MAITDYNPPVDQLLHQAPHDAIGDWSSYLNLGITSEQIPELIQMVGDQSLYEDESEEEAGKFYWAAPIHAWRMLGQLKAVAAIEPLIDVIRQYMEDLSWGEWIIEEIPHVFALIGPAALPSLVTHLADATQSSDALGVSINAIAHIGMEHPEHRQQCIEILAHQLESYAVQDLDLNAFLVTALAADLKAVEAAPLIEQAFKAEKVDEMFMGDWDEVQVELGLKTRAEVPLKYSLILDTPSLRPSGFDLVASDFRASETKASQAVQRKTKRKQQKAARRKNRKKKK